MGAGRTLDRSLGRLAVKKALRHALPLIFAAGVLTGCKDISTVAGIATGSGVGAATGNPALGFVVGVAVGTATNFAQRYYTLVRQGAEQDVIAETAGALPVGGEAPWRIRHTIPIGNEHGDLRVVGTITTPIAECKEVVFSVVDGKDRQWFTIDVCRDPRGWKWATAEPSVARWEVLQ